MMNIEIKDVISLNDNSEYVVAGIASKEKKYYYLVDINNIENIKFCEETLNNTLKIVEDENLLQSLIPLFAESGKSIIQEVIDENNN